MDDPSLRVARHGAVLRLTLNRPARLNALTAPLLAALTHAVTHPGDARAILLDGAGRAFCAGQDLNDVPEGADLGTVLETGFNPLVSALRAAPLPVLAAVHGTAAGAGANLAFAADIVLAARSARFIQSFVHVGLVPDSGGTLLLPQAIGDARARALFLLGEPLPAPTAEQWGLIWRTVDDDALAAEALRTAETLAALPTHALALTKRLLGDGALAAQLAREAAAQREAGRTADHREGLAAFRDKRPPTFTGRP